MIRQGRLPHEQQSSSDLGAPSHLVDAVVENLQCCVRSFAALPGAELQDDGRLTWVLTGLPYTFFNAVARTRLEPGDADRAIERVIARCRERGAPLRWWVCPGDEPAGLRECLLAHGLTHRGDGPGMAAHLTRLELPPTPDGLTIRQVDGDRSLRLWAEVLAAGNETPDDAGLWYRLGSGLGLKGPWRHFLGIVRGEIVASASLFLGGLAAGIYNVATVPAARRQGVGAALTAAAMREARDRGYRLATLQSSPSGLGVYGRLGFQEQCALGAYVLPGEPG